jgi:protein RecA
MKQKSEESSKAKVDFGTMSVEQAMVALNEKYGANSFTKASDVPLLRRVSSGCFAFDFLTGGGFPERRFTELNGMESSFKSTLALSGMAQFMQQYLKQDPLGIYIDLEKTFERKHAKRLGVVTDRCWIFEPDNGEEAVDGIVDALQISRPIFAVLDSLAALRPKKEHEVDMIDNLKIMGLPARLAGHAMASINGRLKRTKIDKDFPPIVFIVLNQLREKVGMVFGNPEYTPGGKTKDYYYSMTVRLRRESKSVKRSVTVNGVTQEITVEQGVGFDVKKNKAGGPQRGTGEFSFNFDTYKYNNAQQAFEYGMFYDLVTKSPFKKKFAYTFGSIDTPLPADEFVSALDDNPEELEELYFAILEKISPTKTKKGIKCA